MNVIYDPADVLEVLKYGIDIPISFNNARETMRRIFEARGLDGHSGMGPAGRPGWYYNKLAAEPDRRALEAVHDKAYIGRLLDSPESLRKEILRTFELIDENGEYYRYYPEKAILPLEHLFHSLLYRGGGTVRAAQIALEKGEAWYFGGGFHHAHFDHGSGFCVFNDVLVARHCISDAANLPLTWVIDIDAHKGDGTAALVRRMHDRGEKDCIALSIHMADGWPLDEERIQPEIKIDPAWTPSDIDIPVAEGEEDFYNPRLQKALEQLEQMSMKSWGRRTPDLAFVLAGADPFEEDMLPSTGLLKLSRHQMLQRNTLVREFLRERDIPAAYVQAGNYGDNSWKTYLDFLDPLIV